MYPYRTFLAPLAAVLAASALAGCAAPVAVPTDPLNGMSGVLGAPAQALPAPQPSATAAPALSQEAVQQAAAAARASADAQGALRSAENAYARGDWVTAAREFKALTNSYPRNSQVWFGYGAAAALSGSLEDAAQGFEAVLRIDPQDARAAYNLGLVRLSQAELALNAARSHSAAAPADIQQEIARLSRDLGPMFSRPAASAPQAQLPAIPAAVQQGFRTQDPARAAAGGARSGALLGMPPSEVRVQLPTASVTPPQQ